MKTACLALAFAGFLFLAQWSDFSPAITDRLPSWSDSIQRLATLQQSLPKLKAQENQLTPKIGKLANEVSGWKARIAGANADKELVALQAEFEENHARCRAVESGAQTPITNKKKKHSHWAQPILSARQAVMHHVPLPLRYHLLQRRDTARYQSQKPHCHMLVFP